MKTYKILIIAMLFSLPLLTKASDDSKLKIGAGYINSSFNSDNSFSNRNGIYVGLHRVNKIIPGLHLTLGMGYEQKGDGADHLDYITVPAALNLKLGPIYGIGQIGFNVKINEDLPESSTAEYKGYDIPVFLGAGFKILMFAVEGGYEWGLPEISEGQKSNTFKFGVALYL